MNTNSATLLREIDNETRSDVATALTTLGVNEQTLTAEQKASLDNDGYVIIPNAITTEYAAHLAQRLEEIAAEEGEEAGKDFHTEVGATRLGSLMNKDPDFDICFLHPTALAAVARVTEGDFGLSSLTGRAAKPGEGLQGFHRDHGSDQGKTPTANALWILSDFTEDNGPTRLVPGTHLWTMEELLRPENCRDPPPDQTCIIAPAGTLVVINGFTWHGGTRNNTQKNRHLVSAFFTNRHSYQNTNRTLHPHVEKRLNDSAKVILDFNKID